MLIKMLLTYLLTYQGRNVLGGAKRPGGELTFDKGAKSINPSRLPLQTKTTKTMHFCW